MIIPMLLHYTFDFKDCINRNFITVHYSVCTSTFAHCVTNTSILSSTIIIHMRNVIFLMTMNNFLPDNTN